MIDLGIVEIIYLDETWQCRLAFANGAACICTRAGVPWHGGRATLWLVNPFLYG